MIGDKISYYPEYKKITDFVIKNFQSLQKSNSRLCISVGGESGCGKTSLANSLKIDIEKALELKSVIFHLDDYFLLPPADNHKARQRDTNLVGMNEVNLKLLDSHLNEFKKGGTVLNKPLINYKQNKILNEHISCSDLDFCIVEGTYVNVLNAPDYKLFMEITYLETRKLRIHRGRDLINAFNEEILEIEHRIIKPHHNFANVIIDKDLNFIIKK